MISVFGCDMTQEEYAAVKECIASQWIGIGSAVSRFEEQFAKHLGIDHFVMTDNCSNALYLAVKLLDLPKGSVVVLPSYTWVACAHAVVLAGHRPAFADVDLDTMNITYQAIDACMAKHRNVAAVMVVHYAGLSVEMNPILDIGLPVIEDAAHAPCSTYCPVQEKRQQRCGTVGDVGAFSFDSIKNISSCDGGGLAFMSPSLAGKAAALRYCGISKSGFEAATSVAKKTNRWWEYQINDVFVRAIPNNVSAAIASVQLNRLPSLQKKRKHIWDRYQSGFEKLKWVVRPKDAVNAEHSYFTYCIRTPRRDELAQYLLENGVYTTLRYHPLHMNAVYGQTHLKLPNCERLNEEALNLPLHPRMADDDTSKIIELIGKFGKKHGI